MIRSKLRYAEQEFPSPTPIKEWSHFWEYLEAQRGRPVVRPTGHDPSIKAFARVDEGRWIADCPWKCGASFTLPKGVKWFWCTECVGGSKGLTSDLVWPEFSSKLVTNLESQPSLLQFWPCADCLHHSLMLCKTCLLMQGVRT